MEKQKANQKLIWAIILNLLIIVLEIIGVVLSAKKYGIRVFEYYTENSNYFALIVSVIFVVDAILAIKRKRIVSIWVFVLRFIASVCLTITLVVVLIILVPTQHVTFVEMMFQDSCLYQHLLCPVISLISFLFFENQQKLPKKSILISLLPTIIYGTICIFLNLTKVITGPYPFFYFYVIPWHVSVFSIVAIVAGAVIISFVLYLVFNRKRPRSFMLV